MPKTKMSTKRLRKPEVPSALQPTTESSSKKLKKGYLKTKQQLNIPNMFSILRKIFDQERRSRQYPRGSKTN